MKYYLNSFYQNRPFDGTVNVEIQCDTESPAGIVSVPCPSFTNEACLAQALNDKQSTWDENTLAKLASQQLGIDVSAE